MISGHCRDKRSKELAFPGSFSCDEKPRKLLLGELYEGIPFCVLELDVVLWVVFLYEVVLEKDRFHLVIGDDMVNGVHMPEKSLGLWVKASFLEITANQFPDALRLSYLNDLSRVVLEKVASRVIGQVQKHGGDEHGIMNVCRDGV